MSQLSPAFQAKLNLMCLSGGRNSQCASYIPVHSGVTFPWVPSPVLGAVNSKEKEGEIYLAGQVATVPHAPRHLPLPWVHFIPGLVFSGLVLGSWDIPFHQCPSCLLSCAFKQREHLWCQRPKSSFNLCLRTTRQARLPLWPPGRRTCLKTGLQDSSQKDKTPIRKHLTQGMVWNEDPGLFTLVASGWSTKVGGEGPGRDCPMAIQSLRPCSGDS